MPKIDYYSIESELSEILKADATLDGVHITVEDNTDMEGGSWVGIFLLGRELTEGQPLAMSTRIRYRLNFLILCWDYSLDSIADAIQKRDDLIGKVEIALLKNPTINNLVNYSFLEGGELESAQLEETAGFIAGGEIRLRAELTASTV